jgi:hypothetical protein
MTTSKKNQHEKEHPFHKTIGKQLREMEPLGHRLILDEACENTNEIKEQISLFVSEKNLQNRLCKVDAMITKTEDTNETVKIIIEIEESDFSTTTICGKYLTSALANNYINRDGNKIHIPQKSVFFIQIIDLRKYLETVVDESKSKKEEQLKIIYDEINKNLVGSIHKYEIIFIDRQKPDFSKLREIIKEHLNLIA